MHMSRLGIRADPDRVAQAAADLYCQMAELDPVAVAQSQFHMMPLSANKLSCNVLHTAPALTIFDRLMRGHEMDDDRERAHAEVWTETFAAIMVLTSDKPDADYWRMFSLEVYPMAYLLQPEEVAKWTRQERPDLRRPAGLVQLAQEKFRALYWSPKVDP